VENPEALKRDLRNSMNELCTLEVFNLAQLYHRGEISPVEVVKALKFLAWAYKTLDHTS